MSTLPAGASSDTPQRRQCEDCLKRDVVTWTKSVSAPRCDMHTVLRRSYMQSKWRAEKAGRTFPPYEARVLTARRLMVTPGQIDEIFELMEVIAAAAHEIGSKRGDATLGVFSELAASRRRLLEMLGAIRVSLHEPRN